jgi:lipopolysaccharide exporter
MAIGLAAAPVLTRLYGPENFGTIAILTSLATIFGPSATLSYVRAVPLAADRAGRRDLVVLCALILLTGTALVTAAAFAGGQALARLYGVAELATYAFALPLLFLLGGAEQIITMLLNCERRYGIVAVRAVLAAAVAAAGSILAGILYFGHSTAGLLFGALAGALVGTLFSGTGAVRAVLMRVNVPFRFAAVRAAASRHRKFAQYTNWALTINTVSHGLPVFLLGVFFLIPVVGFYALANRLVSVPISLFTSASSQAYYIEAAAAYPSTRNARSVTMDLVRTLSTLTTFPLLAVMALGPALFSVAFGAGWREAGVYAQIIALWVLVQAVASPITGMYFITDRQGEALFLQAALVAGRAIALLIGGWLLQAVIPSLILFTIASVLVYAWGLFRCLGFAGVSRRAAAVILAGRLVESVAILAPAAAVAWILHSDMGGLLLGVAGAGVYGLVMWRRHPQVVDRMAAKLREYMAPVARRG